MFLGVSPNNLRQQNITYGLVLSIKHNEVNLYLKGFQGLERQKKACTHY